MRSGGQLQASCLSLSGRCFWQGASSGFEKHITHTMGRKGAMHVIVAVFKLVVARKASQQGVSVRTGAHQAYSCHVP